MPGWGDAVADSFLKFILVLLLLLVLFHGEDVVEEPLENCGVTVDRNIDLVIVADFFQTAIEVFHILDEQASGESKVPLLILAIIDHMDHDAVLEFKILAAEHFEATA